MPDFDFKDSKFYSKKSVFNNDVYSYGTLRSLGDVEISGYLDLQSKAAIKEVFEKVVVKNDVTLNGTIDINIFDGSLINFTNNATGNFSFNLIGGSIGPLNSSMIDGQSLTITLLCPMSGSAFVITSNDQIKIDGIAQTVKWLGGSSPTSGFVNCINVYTFVVIKTTIDNYTILGSLSRFG